MADLKNAVCMVFEEGNIYKFSHRSFQAYFASVYTSEKLTDEMQKRLFRDVLYNNEAYMYDDYFELLNQIERERFAVNALEDGLRDLQKKANESKDPDRYLLKQQTIELHFSIDKKAVKVFRVTHKSGHNNYNNNLIFIIKHIIYPSPENIFRTISAKTFFTELSDILILTPFGKKEHIGEGEIIEGWINFDDIDNSNEISAEIKQKIYNLFLGFTCGGTMLREKIYELMERIDSERTNLTKDNYIENF